MTKVILLNPGHGGKDPGAVGNGLKEKDIVLKIAKKIQAKLKAFDCKVIMTRTKDEFMSLEDIRKMKEKVSPNAFISIHVNAGGGTGYEDYSHRLDGKASDSDYLQKQMNEAIIKQIGGRNRGTKTANYTVLKGKTVPSVLTEIAFIDTLADAEKLKDDTFIEKAATGHVNGLVNALKLKRLSTSGNVVYVVQTGDSLYKIAAKYKTSVDKIVSLNKLRNPNLIRVGDKLKVK